MPDWFNLKRAGQYVGGRGPRFMAREAKAGRLRAARVGGKGEWITCPEWCDRWVEDQAAPLLTPTRRREFGR